MNEEIFVPIEGCPGFFISNRGRVRKGIAKIVKTITANGGYIFLQVRMGGMAKRFAVHRLVAKHFIGDIDGLEINHKDFDKANNYFENLEIVTRRQNMQHYHGSEGSAIAYKKISKSKTGIPRGKKGEVKERAIISVERFKEIKDKSEQQAVAALANLRALVEKHGVTHQALANRIQNEKTGQPIRKQSVTGMLNRRFSPTIDTVFQMLNALNELTGMNYTLKDLEQ